VGGDRDQDDTSVHATLTLSHTDVPVTELPVEGAPMAPPPPRQRYTDAEPLGAGGMGEVVRVHDRVLDRTVAMKVIRPDTHAREGADYRFLAEARATARLQHPGIVPVYDLGHLEDGRPFFTMQEVRGRTFASAIADLHRHGSATGWGVRRLVDALLRACEAVAFAHELGVVHRDLKPANLLLGENGEVFVVDWGLAWSLSEETPTGRRSIEGTPAYMAPEQARGELDDVDARADVYALGAVLYEVLTGARAHQGTTSTEVLKSVLAGPPAKAAGPEIPEDLAEAAHRAMAPDPDARFPNARALADELRACLDGARRREQALALVRRAEERESEATRLRLEVDALRRRAEARLAGVPAWAPEDEKAAGWALQDEAESVAARAERADLDVDRELAAALRLDPTCPEAHEASAARQLAKHAAAEASRDGRAALQAEAALREHAAVLPEHSDVRRRALDWLDGDGLLTLVTDPPGAEVRVFRYVRLRRKLVPVPTPAAGTTPLRLPLPRGSYLCEIRHPACDPVRYPVEIGRGAPWDGIPPGGSEPAPVRLPPEGSLGSDDIYVPAGWFRAGGDPLANHGAPAERRWCDAFVIRRHPVTLGQLILFLDALVAAGREEEALRIAPRERAATAGELGTLVLGRTPEGGFCLREVDADGDPWSLDWPAFSVDWHGARAYAAWEAERTGLPWRLPTEHEWEKAARGVDGRCFPWGDAFDPTRACMRSSHPGRATPAPITAFPSDESPYGVRGMCGNMRDWTSTDTTLAGAPARVDRGGAWFDVEGNIRCANRRVNLPELRGTYLGFRLARDP
jgi:formylglycine-generating enzyme required for sulfatase activity